MIYSGKIARISFFWKINDDIATILHKNLVLLCLQIHSIDLTWVQERKRGTLAIIHCWLIWLTVVTNFAGSERHLYSWSVGFFSSIWFQPKICTVPTNCEMLVYTKRWHMCSVCSFKPLQCLVFETKALPNFSEKVARGGREGRVDPHAEIISKFIKLQQTNMLMCWTAAHYVLVQPVLELENKWISVSFTVRDHP